MNKLKVWRWLLAGSSICTHLSETETWEEGNQRLREREGKVAVGKAWSAVRVGP